MTRRARSLFQWTLVVSLAATTVASTPEWTNELSPIGPRDWTPAAVAALAAMTPERAVDTLVNYQAIPAASAAASTARTRASPISTMET